MSSESGQGRRTLWPRGIRLVVFRTMPDSEPVLANHVYADLALTRPLVIRIMLACKFSMEYCGLQNVERFVEESLS